MCGLSPFFLNGNNNENYFLLLRMKVKYFNNLTLEVCHFLCNHTRDIKFYEMILNRIKLFFVESYRNFKLSTFLLFLFLRGDFESRTYVGCPKMSVENEDSQAGRSLRDLLMYNLSYFLHFTIFIKLCLLYSIIRNS